MMCIPDLAEDMNYIYISNNSHLRMLPVSISTFGGA